MGKRYSRRFTRRPWLEVLESRTLLSVWADFNGDGFADLAVGVPGEGIGNTDAAGAVNVLYGSASGLGTIGQESWNQGSAGICCVAEDGDQFGDALAAGDFNGDGLEDLAIGVPGESTEAIPAAGMVVILYGSPTGLTSTGPQGFHQDTEGVADAGEQGDFFGKTLATGDFDADGFDDLLVGVPEESLGNLFVAGSMHIFYGSATGLSVDRNGVWNLNSTDVAGTAAVGDKFASSLAVGDFDADGFADVAVGVPYADIGAASDAGAVGVLYGSPTGLTGTESETWHQDVGALPDAAEADDFFGLSVAAGDFNIDGRDDLAVGVPGEDVNAIVDAGAAAVLYGASHGLNDAGSGFLTQSMLGGQNTSEPEDFWGITLAAGDFNGGKGEDLAIGCPFQDVGSMVDAGLVNVVYGSRRGLKPANAATLMQENAGDFSESDDRFGDVLGSADFNGDGNVDLVIGTPHEDVGSVVDAGSAFVVYGGSTFSDGEIWHQDVGDIFGVPETNDYYGGGLDAGPGRTKNNRTGQGFALSLRAGRVDPSGQLFDREQSFALNAKQLLMRDDPLGIGPAAGLALLGSDAPEATPLPTRKFGLADEPGEFVGSVPLFSGLPLDENRQ